MDHMTPQHFTWDKLSVSFICHAHGCVLVFNEGEGPEWAQIDESDPESGWVVDLEEARCPFNRGDGCHPWWQIVVTAPKL